MRLNWSDEQFTRLTDSRKHANELMHIVFFVHLHLLFFSFLHFLSYLRLPPFPVSPLFHSIKQPVQDLKTEVHSCQSNFLFLKMLSFFSEIRQNKWDTYFLFAPFLLWFERCAQQRRTRERGLVETETEKGRINEVSHGCRLRIWPTTCYCQDCWWRKLFVCLLNTSTGINT